MTARPHRGAVHAAQRRGFPRWRLCRRIYQDTETTLGSLPLLLLTPIFAAALAAFLATSQPPEVVRNGVVIGPSSFTNLVLAVVGGVGGVAAAAAGTFLVLLARYLGWGDPTWSAHNWGSRPQGATGPESFGTVILTCKVTPRFRTMDLGDYECWIRTPTRQVWELLSGSYFDGGRGGVNAMVARLVDGKHHVRWYATGVGTNTSSLPARPSSSTERASTALLQSSPEALPSQPRPPSHPPRAARMEAVVRVTLIAMEASRTIAAFVAQPLRGR